MSGADGGWTGLQVEALQSIFGDDFVQSAQTS